MEYAVTLVQAFFTLFAKSIDNSASYKYKTFIFELETWFKVNGKHLPKDTLWVKYEFYWANEKDMLWTSGLWQTDHFSHLQSGVLIEQLSLKCPVHCNELVDIVTSVMLGYIEYHISCYNFSNITVYLYQAKSRFVYQIIDQSKVRK